MLNKILTTTILRFGLKMQILSGVHYYKGRLCVMMLRGKELFYGEDVFTVLVPEMRSASKTTFFHYKPNIKSF